MYNFHGAMIKVTIRDFTPADQSDLSILWKGIFDEKGWPEKYRSGLNNIYDYFELPKGICIVAEVAGSLIGCCGLVELEGGYGLLKRFYVDNNYRRQGIGEAILSEIIQKAKTKNIKTLVLETGKSNSSGNSFYQKHNFQQFHPSQELASAWMDKSKLEDFNFYKLELV